MLILAVDTSGRQASLAILKDLDVLASTGGTSDEPYASRLFGDLQRVLGEAAVELAQIELFAVGTGPGAFTGLRVGLAAVKAWAEAFNRPIAPVSGLAAVAVQAQRSACRRVAPVIDARGGKLYGAVFERPDSATGQIQLVSGEVVLGSEECVTWIAGCMNGQRPLLVTPTRKAVETALAGSPLAGAELEEVSGDLAPFIGRLGYQRALRGEVVDALALEANYIRRSDAEVKLEG